MNPIIPIMAKPSAETFATVMNSCIVGFRVICHTLLLCARNDLIREKGIKNFMFFGVFGDF